MERSLDRRLSAKSCDRMLAKNNKMGVVRTKTYPLFPSDRNGSHPSASHTRSNSFKDRKYSERDLMEELVNVSPETYVSCAVGRKRSAARFSLENVNEVVSFIKMLADECPCEVSVPSVDYQHISEDYLVPSVPDASPDEDSEDHPVSSVSAGSAHNMFKYHSAANHAVQISGYKRL
jgi:hypothetical protein